jgi:hypothetical protein
MGGWRSGCREEVVCGRGEYRGGKVDAVFRCEAFGSVSPMWVLKNVGIEDEMLEGSVRGVPYINLGRTETPLVE